MRINANISAIISNNSLQKAEDKLSQSLERLSSGYKINHASDDAAGMAISLKMKVQLRGLNQSDNNAADGVSVIQTAEGAIAEIQSMLERMKELSVQAANDTNSDTDREAIQMEINSLNKEIDRISSDTEFNSQPLINGNLERKVYTRGGIQGIEQFECSENIAAGDYELTVTSDARQAVVHTNAVNLPATIPQNMEGTITIDDYDIPIEKGDTADTVMTKLSSAMSLLGGKAFMTTDATSGNGDVDYAGYTTTGTINGNNLVLMTNEYGSKVSLNVKCNNPDLANALGMPGAAEDGGFTVTGKDVVASMGAGFANTATISTEGDMITVKDVDNKTFILQVPGDISKSKFTDVNGAAGGTATTSLNSSTELSFTQQVTDIGGMKVHVGANEDQYIPVEINAISTKRLNLDEVNVMSFKNASRSIEKIDNAISKVSAIRSQLGAYENRIEHTQNNLATSTENLTAAVSRMIDTDMAEEMTEYTSQNVLAQAGTSILSQANARPETALQLLQK